MFHVKQSGKHLQLDKLEQYKALVVRYQHTLDLMSARAVTNLDTKLLEASAYAKLLEPRLSPDDRILDLGSGAGLPGILLALAFPNHQVTLVERRKKRASFLKLVVGQLGLEHVTVVSDDVRAFQDAPYNWICAQAVGQFSLLYCLTRHLHTATVTIVSRRGDLSPTEIAPLTEITGPVLETVQSPLPTHGKLVLLRLQGGQRCPSSV